ncbi:MAG: SelB C-terminal domain-containing protein, partial [Solirubrobacteraceae bacterium]
GAAVVVSHRIEARLALHEPLRDRERVQVHHGTRAGAARAMRVDDELWQLRSERPFIVADGDRVVVRRIAPPGTLGGGVVVDAAARGRRTANRRPGDPPDLRPGLPPPAAELDAPAIALEERLRLAGHEPPSEQELGDAARHLPALRAHGRAVRVGRAMHAHPEAIAAVGALAARIVEAEGSISVGRLRDELGTSRRYASALLEHLDATRVTLRLDDDRRIMRRTRPRG